MEPTRAAKRLRAHAGDEPHRARLPYLAVSFGFRHSHAAEVQEVFGDSAVIDVRCLVKDCPWYRWEGNISGLGVCVAIG